ncbi:MAG: radical SAM family heme chaperone HemW [Agarilytica sp.]
MTKHNAPLQLLQPPLAAYIHIPWCVKKCPYCDFNSHTSNEEIPFKAYIKALEDDLLHDLEWLHKRPLGSIFFGGGTPSLMPAEQIGEIIELLEKHFGFENSIEITLEANPGTVEHGDFHQLRAAGVNRLSMGVQSFADKHLTALGRIHSTKEAKAALIQARECFDNFNIDLMHGLPGQTSQDALADLAEAFSFSPSHISWYQLTIEQNTEFYSRPPSLPHEDTLLNITQEGSQALLEAGFVQYEVSAYARAGKASQHNLNYWQFGDYIALGAGAHGKITLAQKNQILRYQKTRLPKDYLERSGSRSAKTEAIPTDNLALEFVMNALRLNQGFSPELFESRTGLSFSSIAPTIKALSSKGLIEYQSGIVRTSALGRNFLNTVLEHFT